MSKPLELTGLDGSNPLAFLAALGTLRTLSLAWRKENVRMCWIRRGRWIPILVADCELPNESDQHTARSVIKTLDAQLKEMLDHPAFSLADNLNVSPISFRKYAEGSVSCACPEDRRWADFAASFGCEATKNNDVIQDTALRTMSGAGHQHFLRFMRELVKETDADHIWKTLFCCWTYKDEGLSMRWDPIDDRRYALRWDNPSKQTKRNRIYSVRAANRLAIEGLPLFPTAPVANTLRTTGFAGRGREGTFWNWPIWEVPITVDVVRSLLSQHELQDQYPSRRLLKRWGVSEVFRSQRITTGKYRNFSPAQAV